MQSLWKTALLVQALFFGAAGIAWSLTVGDVPRGAFLRERTALAKLPVVTRQKALEITPFYNEPGLVSDSDLAMVLGKIAPRFPASKLKPNYVEHALRTWTIEAEFLDPRAMSGVAMKDYLVDHSKYLAAWGDKVEPLLGDRPEGVDVRWGKSLCASVHHDHWLACLTEAGVSLDELVFTPNRRDRTIRDVLTAALTDFHLDEVETEWSTLAFALWLAHSNTSDDNAGTSQSDLPAGAWVNGQGRALNLDLLAERLIRGHQRLGVCAGTHRVYSLMALIRLDDEYHLLQPETRKSIWTHLEWVRDQIAVSQFEDGHWPSNWSDGADALSKPVADELYRKVIATGHHLEWLAIAPQSLHPPREQIEKAARWLIDTTSKQSEKDILDRYTFFSHVGKALSLWRGTTPARFYRDWQAAHPMEVIAPVPESEPAKEAGSADAH